MYVFSLYRLVSTVVSQYFNHVSVGPILNQMDSSGLPYYHLRIKQVGKNCATTKRYSFFFPNVRIYMGIYVIGGS